MSELKCIYWENATPDDFINARRGDEMSLEMKYIPTAFTRDDAEREARKLYSVQESDWDALPENIRLSLMLDATILLLSRKLLEAN